ncbi:MAG TPA: hypothetical protein VIV11_30020 [Kofleriaceae bacterium]
MKKIAIVLFVAATALAGCGKKKAPAAPTDTGSAAAPADPAAGSGDAGSAAAPEAGSAGGGM